MNEAWHMSLTRLRALLDAYGADPDRWPPEERDAGRALLARLPQAQRWQDASAQLDALLDRAPVVIASPALVERVLAAAPQRANVGHAIRSASTAPPGRRFAGRARAWRYVAAALPLAAAAVLVLWLWAKPPPTPERAAISIANLGTYTAPTDVLLALPSVEALDTVPSFGCANNGLGCLDLAPSDSHSALNGEMYA